MTSTEALTTGEREFITRVVERVVEAPFEELAQVVAHARRRGAPVTEREVNLARDAMLRTRVELARQQPLEPGDRVRVTGVGSVDGEPDPDGHRRPQLGSSTLLGAEGVVTSAPNNRGYVTVNLQYHAGGTVTQTVSYRDLERI